MIVTKHHDNEQAIKTKVLDRLRRSGRFGPRPLIASEYCIGSTGVRADLVVASATRELIGIEIKSASDTLTRLERQLDAYTEYFDRVIVVAAQRHQEKVRALTTKNIEIWAVEQSGTLGLVREGTACGRGGSLADLMTQRDRVRYRGLLAQGAEGTRDAFFAAFEDRHGLPSKQFWDSATSAQRRPDTLKLLSRFNDIRTRSQDAEGMSFSSWSEFEAA